jgi:hypothetical protein
MTTLRSTTTLTGVEVDLTNSTVILFSNPNEQPLSTTEVSNLEAHLGACYPHLLDNNTCNVVVIDNQVPAYPLAV